MDNAVLRDYLNSAVRRHGARAALVADGRTWTYAELDAAAAGLAGTLQRQGITPGAPVAILLPNCAEYVIADLAIALLGAAKVPINLMLADDEIAYILHHCGATVAVVAAERLAAVDRARTLGAEPRLVVHGGGLLASAPAAVAWDDALAAGPATPEATVPADSLALIMYTGGTTGLPKGVAHTQYGIAANLLSHVIEMEIGAEDRLLLSSPLPHSAGFLLQAALVRGALVFLESRFDLSVMLDRIEHDRVGYLFLVPTMIYRLLDAVAARKTFDSSALRTILYGAAPMSVERLEQGLELFGPVFMQLFGQSEAPNFLTRLRRDDHRTDDRTVRLRSCGQSVLMAQVRVVGNDGTELGPHEVGEVTARSPYIMRGYLNNDEATAEALRDGWLHTGDLGYLDEDGYLFLVDRKKDLIITGGLNVYTSEVEQAMAGIPEVREAAVVGIPHPDWGEAVVAFVVGAGDEVTEGEILDRTRERLSGYKRPKAVVLVDGLPTTAVGKIDKKKLREGWTGW